MSRALLLILIGLTVLAGAGRVARADAVRLHGSSIPLAGCQLQDIKSGRLHYRDASGRRQWRELDEVAALSFDGLDALDEAERRLAAGDGAGGLHKLLQALLAADSELAQLWVRIRLLRTHDARGEFVQAAGHTAAVYMLREDTYWRYLEPVSKPNEPSYAATLEAMESLSEASRSLINGDLQAVVRRSLKEVRVIHDRLAAQVPDRPTGRTLSGIPVDEIRGEALPAALRPAPAAPIEARPTEPPPRDVSNAAPDRARAPAPIPAPSGRLPAAIPAPGAPDRALPSPPRGVEPAAATAATPEVIEALLEDGRYAEAVDRCRAVAERPGSRSVSRFLHQYGRALAGAGHPRDAAVVFMQCAVLYEASAFAASSLLETAIIYRDEYRSRATARRLGEMAVEAADRDDLAERARRFVATLGPIPAGEGGGGSGER